MSLVVVDAVAYSFGRLGGLIDVSLAEKERAANTRRDRIVVGFRTSISEHETTTINRRLLARVISSISNDFIELSLVRFSSFF